MAAFLVGQVRPRLGVHGHHQPRGLGAASRTRSSRSARSCRRSTSPTPVMSHISMRTDKAPFSDVRVRRAMSMAIDRKGIIDAVYEGVGAINPAMPAALKEWSIPMAELGEGAQYYRYDPTAAKKLLAEAGYPQGLLRDDGLHDLRLHRPRGHVPARHEVPEGRRASTSSSTPRSTAPTSPPRSTASSTRSPSDRRRASSSPTTTSTASTTRASSRTRASSTIPSWPTCSSASGGRRTSPSARS